MIEDKFEYMKLHAKKVADVTSYSVVVDENGEKKILSKDDKIYVFDEEIEKQFEAQKIKQ